MRKEAIDPIRVSDIRVGSKIEITEITPFNGVTPGETALHEAEHIVPNPRNVRWATIHPGPGYLGFTELYIFNSIQAAAPHANGRRGTGHDLRLIEAHGHRISAAISAAGQELESLSKEVTYVASFLQINGEISGIQAEEVMMDALDPKEKIERKDQDGKVISIIARRSQRQSIIYDLQRAA